MTSERARYYAFGHARILTLATLFCQRGLCKAHKSSRCCGLLSDDDGGSSDPGLPTTPVAGTPGPNLPVPDQTHVAQRAHLNPGLPTIFVVGDSTARNGADLD
jgi:hypothetical protein